jgi:hypothetical protein
MRTTTKEYTTQITEDERETRGLFHVFVKSGTVAIDIGGGVGAFEMIGPGGFYDLSGEENSFTITPTNAVFVVRS